MITGSSYDSNSENKVNESTHIPSLLLLQLHFNTFRQRGNSENSCHTSAKATPLSIYVAFFTFLGT